MLTYVSYQVEGDGPMFNAPDPTADDFTDDVTWFDIYQAAVGG